MDAFAAEADTRPKLSPREITVLEMAAQGKTNSEIGADLGVTVHAVKFHLASIYRKLGVKNRTQATAQFLPNKSFYATPTPESGGN